MYVYDSTGFLAKCHICGKPATAMSNITANCASSVPSVMQPVCDEHNPYIVKPVNTTGKTTQNG